MKQSEIYILRPSNIIGGGKPFEVIVDDQRKATLKNAGYSNFLLEPGKHKIIIQPESLQFLSASTDTLTNFLVTEPGKRYFFSFSINSNVRGDTFYIRQNTLTKITEESAVQMLKDLRYSE